MQLKKSMGQNFLKDANILRKEVVVGDVAGKHVLEIGPGDGRLTEKILEAGPKHVTVVEKDARFVAFLRQRFANDIEAGRLEVVEADFLEFGPGERTFEAILGNIPYYISSAIIFRLKDFDFGRAVLIVQKEFAKKMVAKPNQANYGRLSVTSQLFFNVGYVQVVPKHLFSPAPKVDSAMIKLEKTGLTLSREEEDIIRMLFQHKNQSVRKSLTHGKVAKDKLSALGDYEKRRVRTLSKDECLEIAKMLKE